MTEKNDNIVHDFTRDPLRLRMEGDWLMATGTTLGADNGIGVCTALALLDMPTTVKLPPLECLFTIDEETGLTGESKRASTHRTGHCAPPPPCLPRLNTIC